MLISQPSSAVLESPKTLQSKLSKWSLPTLYLTLSLSVLTACSSESTTPAVSDNYLLSTNFQGNDRVLTAVPADAGALPNILLTARDGSSTQSWQIVAKAIGGFNISNLSLGNTYSVDVLNDGVMEQIHFADAADVSGQSWNFTPLGNGYCRLTNNFTGTEISLDIVNDDNDNIPILRSNDNVVGQQWRVVNSDGTPATAEPFAQCSGG